jgi:hypothetical protein
MPVKEPPVKAFMTFVFLCLAGMILGPIFFALQGNSSYAVASFIGFVFLLFIGGIFKLFSLGEPYEPEYRLPEGPYAHRVTREAQDLQDRQRRGI